MRQRIKKNINRPEILEKLYRENKEAFILAFESIYPEIEKYDAAWFWKVRLDYDKPPARIGRSRKSDIPILVAVCIIASAIAEIPKIFNISETDFHFYQKNLGLIAFFGLSLYEILINRTIRTSRIILLLSLFLIPALYINFLPSDALSHSINLAYLHLPLLMWCVYGLVYINFSIRDKRKVVDYIKYNGDLAAMGSLIVIAGMVLTGFTIALFGAIDIHVETFYGNYVVIAGIVSAPVVTAFIIKKYPAIANRIAPVIASIFSPLVLVVLLIYLAVLPFSTRDPYNDREFLLVFNLMLIGVTGIIVFSVSEISRTKRKQFSKIVLFILSIVTIIINLIALSAIFYRLGEYGISPNKIAVLGSNILIFINLLLIMIDLYRVNFRNEGIEKVELTISRYLPFYMAWTAIVVFAFPAVFSLA
jgi:hypothetical protein